MRRIANVRRVRLFLAEPRDAAAIAALRNRAADALTDAFGPGHWSSHASEKGVRSGMKRSSVYVARRRGRIVATLTLQTRKPWAIDMAYFSPRTRPLYLIDMAVEPTLQRAGIGRACLEAARGIAARLPADAIRLDAYDAEAGAGTFYAKCGYREVGRVVYRNTPLVYYEIVV
ncbi:MAG: GNAT family N-acetyltransferase [Candidatus Latescibacteria bacterium]|nr:GNAT family N-acetyltransferase [Candidatus Latescibacterota bacterium]